VADTNICATRCKEEYGKPLPALLCPANVYEIVRSSAGAVS